MAGVMFPPTMLSSSLSMMGGYLRESFNATDDELAQLQEILDFRKGRHKTMGPSRETYASPSIVLDDFLYHGNLVHASNRTLLNQLGIRHIVNVSDCSLDKAIQENFNVLWIQLNDEFSTDIKKHFRETTDFLARCREKNEKVLVHCQMGISRSSSIVLAYLLKYHHKSLKEAYEYLLQRRRVAAPNLSFFLQLLRFEKELLAQKEIDEHTNIKDKHNPLEQLDPSLDPAIQETESKSDG